MSVTETQLRPHAKTAMPPVVTQREWDLAREQLLRHEKAVTHAEDEAAAARRAMPMVKVEGDWELQGPDGPVRLIDLFEGRRQLVLYHHMLKKDDPAPCPGCSGWGDGVPRDISYLHVNDVTLALIAVAPLDQIDAYKERMGWTMPFYSSDGSSFNDDMNPNQEYTGAFGVSVFLRDGTDIYRTYMTLGRGAEKLTFGSAMIEITPFGRQETWERSPAGWPQAETYTRGGLHTERSAEELSGATAPSSTG